MGGSRCVGGVWGLTSQGSVSTRATIDRQQNINTCLSQFLAEMSLTWRGSLSSILLPLMACFMPWTFL